MGLLDPSRDVGARNERRMVALYCNTTAGFEVIHGFLDRVLAMLGCEPEGGGNGLAKGLRHKYRLDEGSDPMFFPGRCGDVILDGEQKIGSIGILHPDVLAAYEIT